MNYNPNYNYNQQPQKLPAHPQVISLVDSAFGKGLAAAIMAWFPIASIVAIFLGFSAKSTTQQASDIAMHYNCEYPGKGIAAKVLGLVGGIAGIVMTVIWVIYFIALGAVLAIAL